MLDRPLDPQVGVTQRRWWILGVLVLSLVIVSLDNTVLNAALPAMQRDLQASTEELQWIVDGYLLAFAALILLAGNLGDRFGRKPALQCGLLTFGAGSMLAVFADTTTTVLVARVVMGIGAAFIMPATLSVVMTVFTGRDRAAAIGIWTAGAGVGVALGPVLGGWLLDHFWWGSVFLINVPIVAVAAIAGFFLVPNSLNPVAGRPDPVGAALSSVGFTCLIYAVISIPAVGFSDPTVLASFALAVLVLTAFVAVELRAANPMLPLWLFRSRRFSVASGTIGVLFFAMTGSLYFLTQYLQVVRGFSGLEAGIRTLPVAAGLAAAAPWGPWSVAKFGSRAPVACGMALSALGLAAFSLVGAGTSDNLALLALLILGLGMGLVMGPATESIMSAVPAEMAGVGSAVNDMVRQLGGALGVAVLGSVLSVRFSDELSPGLGALGLPEGVAAATDSVGASHALAVGMPGEMGPIVRQLGDSAFLAAMGTAALVAAGLVYLGAIAVLESLPARSTGPARMPAVDTSSVVIGVADAPTAVIRRAEPVGRHRARGSRHLRPLARHAR